MRRKNGDIMKFKKLVLTVLTSFTALIVVAVVAYATSPLGLKMGQVKALVGTISANLTDATTAPVALDAAVKLEVIAKEIREMIPAKALGNEAAYQDIIDRFIAAVKDMEIALAAGNMEDAKKDLNTLLALKAEGHTKFK